MCAYFLFSMYTLLIAFPELVAFGQVIANICCSFAIAPQVAQNYSRQQSGGYSPITASLACTGCIIRLFTTQLLADSDPLLLGGNTLSLTVNFILLFQIIYYGINMENKSVFELFFADFNSNPKNKHGQQQ